jgi:arginyl-tRNA synthetase
VEGGAVVEEEKKGEEKKGDDAKKPKIGKMKTREGDSTKLMDLLDEAKNRTLDIFKERMKEDEEGDGIASKVQVDMGQLEKTAEIMGISSVKYYDLKQNRVQNYVFAFDKMLDPRGNTGVYLLYMYVRVLSILRKGSYESEILQSLIANPDAKFKISNKSERELAIALLRLPEQIDLAMTDLQLNRLTDQLYEIAVKIGEFYQQSKVLGSEEEKSRILLLEATRKIMHVLFNLLGMKTIERI